MMTEEMLELPKAQGIDFQYRIRLCQLAEHIVNIYDKSKNKKLLEKMLFNIYKAYTAKEQQ